MKIPTSKSKQKELEIILQGSIEEFKKLTSIYPNQLPLDMARYIKNNLIKYYNN